VTNKISLMYVYVQLGIAHQIIRLEGFLEVLLVHD